MKISLTGFEPFGGYDINPSWEAARIVGNKVDFKAKVTSHKIPLVFNEIEGKIISILNLEEPDILIMLGQAPRACISLERIAMNLADTTRSAYNCGTKPSDFTLAQEGPAAYFTKLPIRKIQKNIGSAGIPVGISNSAGTFGCNQIFFSAMHYIHTKQLETIGGLIHVPLLPKQTLNSPNNPSMSQEMINQAIKISVETCQAYFMEMTT